MEESLAEVLTPGSIRGTIAKANADTSLAARPARDTKGEAIDWPAWNRKHLPKPNDADASAAEGRYDTGPELVRNLLNLAGIDRRTTEGKATTLELLQGRAAQYVPRRLATAIAAEHDLTKAQVDDLTDMIRQAAIGKATFGEITKFVER